MKTEKDLSTRIDEINKLELTGSIQTKKGRYYVVISYTDENGNTNIEVILQNEERSTGIY